MRAPSLIALTLLAGPALAEEDPPVRGLDVLDTVRTVQKWMGPGTPDPQKPWASSLGALTDPDPRIHAPAIRDLVVRGSREAKVVKDLEVLAQDGDWRVRARVVQVLDGIGGERAVPLLLDLSHDREARVRELSTLALGKGAGPSAQARLRQLLTAPENTIREAAAASLGAFGDPQAIGVLAADAGEGDDLVLRAREQALARLAKDPRSVPVLLDLLPASTGVSRDRLLQTAQLTADRRLSECLAAIALDPGAGATGTRRADPSAWTQYLALNAVATCGDLRAVPALVRLATGSSDTVAQRAAQALGLITGFQAQPGKAWTLWWNDRQGDLPRWIQRDAFLAALHDPATPIDRAALASFTTTELTPLVDAVLSPRSDRLAPWFPARALAALRADDPGRWTPVLTDRAIAAPSLAYGERLGLILLIDDLDGPHALEDLGRLLVDLRARIEREEEAQKEQKIPAPDHGPELTALEGAVGRRHK